MFKQFIQLNINYKDMHSNIKLNGQIHCGWTGQKQHFTVILSLPTDQVLVCYILVNYWQNCFNKNLRIQHQAQHSFHYQKRHMNRLLKLTDVLITRQHKYTRWQHLSVVLLSSSVNRSQSNVKISILTANTVMRYSSNQGALKKYTYKQQMQW